MTTITRPGALLSARQRLGAARASGTPCAPVRDLLDDMDAAYAVQSAWVAQRLEAGATVTGRKIGLTSPAVQAQLGVDSPDFGVLLDEMAVAAGGTADMTRLLQPRIEAEVAFVLGADLDLAAPAEADVVAATDCVVAALEIVDSRIAGWDITLGRHHRRQRLGRDVRPRLRSASARPDLDLARCAMTMRRNGTAVSSGAGERLPGLAGPRGGVAGRDRPRAGRAAAGRRRRALRSPRPMVEVHAGRPVRGRGQRARRRLA